MLNNLYVYLAAIVKAKHAVVNMYRVDGADGSPRLKSPGSHQPTVSHSNQGLDDMDYFDPPI